MQSVFVKKYDEFCTDLLGACPELTAEITAAKALPPAMKVKRFKAEVNASPQRKAENCPNFVLPGVKITKAVWAELSEKTKASIQEYLTLLSMCALYEGMHDLSGADQTEFLKGFMENWKEKLAGTDFKKLAEKFTEFLGAAGMGAGAAGAAGAAAGLGGMPNLPERFLKGKIAKFAEELVREFSPEDFGMTEADIRACETNPMRAFEVLMEAYTSRPDILQGAIKKIAHRMQEKIQRGELRPQDLAAEAEEIMKECTDNPQFTEMMEGFRNAFGFADMDTAREAGREGNARLAAARARLRAKLEKRKGQK